LTCRFTCHLTCRGQTGAAAWVAQRGVTATGVGCNARDERRGVYCKACVARHVMQGMRCKACDARPLLCDARHLCNPYQSQLQQVPCKRDLCKRWLTSHVLASLATLVLVLWACLLWACPFSVGTPHQCGHALSGVWACRIRRQPTTCTHDCGREVMTVGESNNHPRSARKKGN